MPKVNDLVQSMIKEAERILRNIPEKFLS